MVARRLRCGCIERESIHDGDESGGGSGVLSWGAHTRGVAVAVLRTCGDAGMPGWRSGLWGVFVMFTEAPRASPCQL